MELQQSSRAPVKNPNISLWSGYSGAPWSSSRAPAFFQGKAFTGQNRLPAQTWPSFREVQSHHASFFYAPHPRCRGGAAPQNFNNRLCKLRQFLVIHQRFQEIRPPLNELPSAFFVITTVVCLCYGIADFMTR